MNSPEGIAVRQARFRLGLKQGTPVLSATAGGVQALLGYDEADFLSGKIALSRLIHADDQDIAQALFSPAAQNREGDVNLRLRQATGRILCVKAHYLREEATDGVVLDLLMQDAKSLPRTMAVATATATIAAMMENTDDHIYFKDRNHVFTGASQSLVALCSQAEHWTDLIGQTDYDVFPEKRADTYYRLEKQVFAGNTIAREVQETLGKDGRQGWVDNRNYPIRNAGGVIIGLYGVARDITERKQAEAAQHQEIVLADRSRQALLSVLEDQHQAQATLGEREARYAAMVKSISDAIISADSAGNVVGWNLGAEHIFGYPENEILGQPLTRLLPARHHAAHGAGLARVAAGGPHHIIGTTVEVEGRRKAGGEFPLNLSLSEWRIADKNFFTAVIRDITAQRLAEKELRRQTEELRTRNETLNRFNQVAVDRELRMIELKREVNELCVKLGEPPRHRIVELAPIPRTGAEANA